MRILMVGPYGMIALQRPLRWALEQGHSVWLAAVDDPFAANSLGNYQFASLPPLPNGADNSDYGDQMRAAVTERLCQVVQEMQPDIIHTHRLGTAAHCCAAAGLGPLVVSIWGAFNGLLQGSGVSLSARHQHIVAAAQALIVESPALVRACQTLVSPSTRVALIPLGADTRRFRPGYVTERAAWRRTLRIPEEAVVLLSPRGWSHTYNHHLVVQAFALAQPRFQRPALLAFVRLGRNGTPGEAEQCYQAVLQEAESLGLTDAIRTLPALRHELMPGLYSLADVVVNYPAHDAFPSTLVEAAACEKPVITACLPSYVGTFIEEFCTLVAPNQATALAEAMVEVVNQPLQDRSDRLTAARQVIMEQYDERLAKERLDELYHALATGR